MRRYSGGCPSGAGIFGDLGLRRVDISRPEVRVIGGVCQGYCYYKVAIGLNSTLVAEMSVRIAQDKEGAIKLPFNLIFTNGTNHIDVEQGTPTSFMLGGVSRIGMP